MTVQMVQTQVRTLVSEPTYGKFEVEPLERGYGVTLGNAMRRVLLSSIPGAAITSVRIEGVLSEFEPIPGVKEDTIHFLLNLKNVAIRIHSTQPRDKYTLRLQVQGPGRVTAADIQAPADVEIVNPELYLATLSDSSARLSAEITVEIGRGYVAALKRERGRGSVGEIRTNALFNPVTKVNFLVEPTLVGERTDYDRLILEVWTNGAIAPEEAVYQAAAILREQFSRLMTLGGEAGTRESTAVVSAPPGVTVPDRPLEDLGLSTRVLNALRSGGIDTLYKLLNTPEQKLLDLRNFGDTAKKEVEEKLSSMGLSLMKSGRRRSQS
ncbi:MAG: DNA-directed RNA polymerase subunit alpha [Armatimonadetes bacterium JP3_11]|jgi:DNA-directed RNA polymerase subunit alpha|nr:MAG: DNA-directed RNA polymerase subunit alpha [Armatimonadetes bacterium CP1_7O]OYT75172.1 MAG: DNA-directed RNA polymerase subunit alpha [Armatimonadetes bacterium JP3_11]RMH10036.1 MAG: DNA-directed RNA polymerase subunit alpha [Armatimonadota bacterium]